MYCRIRKREDEGMFYVVYIIVPIIVLVLFERFAARNALLSIPICILFELVFFWKEFSYYEARPFVIMYTLIQIFVMAIFSMNIRDKK